MFDTALLSSLSTPSLNSLLFVYNSAVDAPDPILTAPTTCKSSFGLFRPIPTRLFVESTTRVSVSTVRPSRVAVPPEMSSPEIPSSGNVSVPVAVRLVNVPADADVAPMVVPSIEPPSMSTSGSTSCEGVLPRNGIR